MKHENTFEKSGVSYFSFAIIGMTEKQDYHGKEREESIMKGYFVTEGYMGFIDNHYMLFASEADYREYYLESK